MTSGKRPFLWCLALLVGLAGGVTGCDWFGGREETVLQGRTMGTTYSVRAIDLPDELSAEVLQARIDQRLADVNSALSTWDPTSEISRFNAAATTEWVAVSTDFHTVVQAAQAVSAASDGAFDATVAPLIELWGFGRGTARESPPDDAEIAALMERVGYRKLEVDPDQPRIRKQHPQLTLNLSAIAKGYGVDAVAAVLEAAGISDYLVEIGGEVRVRGHNVEDEAWRIAIEQPDVPGRMASRVVPLTEGAMATSGDYRNFFMKDDRRYSHLLDPAAGRPVLHRLASVSVVMDTCMEADAYATALMVLGDETAPAFAEARGLAALFMVRTDGAGFAVGTTAAFDRLTATAAAPDAS